MGLCVLSKVPLLVLELLLRLGEIIIPRRLWL